MTRAPKFINRIRKIKINLILFLAILLPFLLSIGITTFFLIFFHGRIFLGVKAAGIPVGALTHDEAVKKLSNKLSFPDNIKLKINTKEGEQSFNVSLSSIKPDFEETANMAVSLGRSSNLLHDFTLIAQSAVGKTNLPLNLTVDDNKLFNELSVIAGQASVEAVNPSIELSGKEVVVNKGSVGEEITTDEIKKAIVERLSNLNFSDISLSTNTIDPTISDAQKTDAQARAETLAGKSIEVTFEFNSAVISGNKLLALINPKGGYYDDLAGSTAEDIAKSFDRPAQNPTFNFNGTRVEEFSPAKDGVEVQKDKLKGQILDSLAKLEKEDGKQISFEAPVKLTQSEVSTSQVNDLGIKELIGRGVSRYKGSISSRVYNINLAASRINGALVKPGDTFSFNAALGDVSKLTGYKEAYIIQDGKTVLGDGGGVCQVSTTLFRAVLNAGLPVIERRAHSYRVGYYEQDAPLGMDATVYSPTTDFKFKNDTGNYILVQAQADTKNMTLVFELYGTKDSRESTITKPVISDITPPPEDLYIDDPTLPAGTIKQIDYKAWGAKSVFNYTVKKNGEVTYKKTFYSNYQPWQAKFLRGTGPAS